MAPAGGGLDPAAGADAETSHLPVTDEDRHLEAGRRQPPGVFVLHGLDVLTLC